MNIMIDVVADVNALVNKYGLLAIRHTLSFIESFPITIKHAIRDVEGNEISITREQLAQIRSVYSAYAPYNKIQAIKRYRELTYVGLKEAKNAVEALIKEGLL